MFLSEALTSRYKKILKYFLLHCVSVFYLKPEVLIFLSFLVSFSWSLLNLVPSVPTCQRANVVYVPVYVPTCLRASLVYVPACLRASVVYVPTCLRANSPKACQLLIFTCQRTNKRSNEPYGVPMFQIGVSACQRKYQFFKHSFYEMLLQISILYYDKKNLHYTRYHSNICVYDVSYIKIALDFISIFHVILKKKGKDKPRHE